MKAGSLTDIAIADLDGDKQPEIIVTGEWMAPAVYNIRNGQLNTRATGLESQKGWWQSVEASDLDGDGDADWY